MGDPNEILKRSIVSGKGTDPVRITVVNENYLDELTAEIPDEAPKKKTKAQKRAEKKQKKILQQIEDKKLIMRDHLRRELELSSRMQKEGQQTWEDMCKEIKLIELKEELLEWNEKAQRNIERKDEKIKFLLEDMEQTQQQHLRNFSKTIEMMDHLRKTYDTLVECTKKVYNSHAEDMLIDYYEEVERKTNEVEFMRENCENVVHAYNVIAADALREDYHIFVHKRADRVNTEIEKRFQLRDAIVAKMRAMQKQLVDFVASLQSTELDAHKYERIRWLTERQMAFVIESKKLGHEEMKGMHMQSELQKTLLHLEVDSNKTINDLRLEVAYFLNMRQKIEETLQKDRDITHQKLRILTTECYDIQKKFQRLVKSGELLLSLAANCRKLMTESEKVVLGSGEIDEIDLGNVDESFKLETLDLHAHVDMTEDELVAQNKLMRNFWRRQSLVETQNLMLQQEKEKLTEENERYINFILSMHKTNEVKKLLATLQVSSAHVPHVTGDEKCRKYGFKR